MNNKGFTLVELMIAGGIGVIVILGASMMLLQFSKANWYTHYTSEEWSNIQLASFILPKYIGQGLNVDWEGPTIGNIGGGRGKIRLFTSGFNSSGIAARPVTIGAFLREAGNPTPSNTGSDIRATGIYFITPTITTPGEILISSSDQGFGNTTISSSNPRHRLDSIVEMQITPAGFPSVSGDPVRAVRLRIVFRRFLDPDQNRWQYCPEAEIPNFAACQTTARFVDETLLLDIPLVNNSIPTDFGTQETLYGNLYFFKSAGGAQ